MLTGFVFAQPIRNKEAGTVVDAYIDCVYSIFGGLRKILSDNGTEFKNKLFTHVARILGVEYKNYTPPYHPQSNGHIEGFHFFLKACLAKHMTSTCMWDTLLAQCCAAYNFFPNEHSQESPFFLMFARDPRLPLSQLLLPKIRYLGNDQSIAKLEFLIKAFYLAAHNMQIA